MERTGYNVNWKDLNTLLMYKSKNFRFSESIIIFELDNCLIRHITPFKLYDIMNTHDLVLNKELVQAVRRESVENNIVIISNQINNSKLNIDMIKHKVEWLEEQIQIPIFCLFALINNCYSKPHTGMWKVTDAFYRQNGVHIKRAIVVSDAGGIVEEKEKKDGTVLSKIKYKDTDRAFAWNVGIKYLSVNEFIDLHSINDRLSLNKEPKQIKFEWNNFIIPPDIRKLYYEQIEKIPQINIFAELGKFDKCESYVIVMLGAPRCGKTTVAKEFIKKWRNSKFGEHNAIKRIGTDNFTKLQGFRTFKKCVDDRISVVLDGGQDVEYEREKFLSYIKDRNIPVLYIEVNVGIQMAKVFNHATVENTLDRTIKLYENRVYHIYKSIYKKPYTNNKNIRHIIYSPKIKDDMAVSHYRY